MAEALERSELLVAKLCSLGVPTALSRVVEGPSIIRAELLPGDSVKMRDYRRLDRADDLAYALAVRNVRVMAPMPGTSKVAVEFPRDERQLVRLDDLPAADPPLCAPLGLDPDGQPVMLALQEAPHLLIAGQTGAGKSNMIHAILCSLLSALSPDELQLCLIDVKRVELGCYENVTHVQAKIADDPYLAISHLQGLIEAMERRYLLLQEAGARDLSECNAMLKAAGLAPIPFLVCVVDELAELMMASRKEAETLIVRLLQKGRAAGIHLILATQSPRVEVVTGLLKVNCPSRIAFSVPTMTDSRVVLDQNGAEKLLGKGDGLFSLAGLPPIRFQAPLVTAVELNHIIAACEAPTEELVPV